MNIINDIRKEINSVVNIKFNDKANNFQSILTNYTEKTKKVLKLIQSLIKLPKIKMIPDKYIDLYNYIYDIFIKVIILKLN